MSSSAGSDAQSDRVCTDCQEGKPIEEFPVVKKATGYRMRQCRLCFNKRGADRKRAALRLAKTCVRCHVAKEAISFKPQSLVCTACRNQQDHALEAGPGQRKCSACRVNRDIADFDVRFKTCRKCRIDV
jgi:hypothetical protein